MKVTRYLVAITLTVGALMAVGQQGNTELDSLTERLQQVKGNEKIETLRNLSKALEQVNYDTAIVVANTAIALSRELEDRRQLGLSLDRKAFIQDVFGYSDEAIETYWEAETYLETGGTQLDRAEHMMNMGMAFHSLGQFEQGLEMVASGKELFQTAKDSMGISECWNNIAIIKSSQNQKMEALEIYFEALSWMPASGKNKGSIIANIGAAFFSLGEYEQALSYYQQAYHLELTEGNRGGAGASLNYMGNIHAALGNIDSSAFCFQKAYDLNLSLKQFHDLRFSIMGLIQVYGLQNNIDQMLALVDSLERLSTYHIPGYFVIWHQAKHLTFARQEKWDSTLVYLLPLLAHYQKTHDWRGIQNNAHHLYEVYREKGEYEKSLQYFQLHAEAKDSLFSIENAKIVQTLHTQYETEKKEAEIARLTIEEANARLRTKAWVIGAILIGILAVVLLLFQRLTARKNREIQAGKLRNQIASDLHDEMGSVLTGISMQAQMLQLGDQEEQHVYAEKILTNSQNAMVSMRDVIWSIDSRYDQLGSLVDRMRGLAFEMLNPLGIQWEFHEGDWDWEQTVGPDVRQSIYLIFKEAVNNIVKHAPKDKVIIALSKIQQQWTLDISNFTQNPPEQGETDFPTAPKSLGQGLTNMQARAQEIEAKLTIIQDQGFQVLLRGQGWGMA